MTYYMKGAIETRNTIFENKSYVPWQPAFEKFGAEYNNRIQMPGSSLSGIVADFYEIGKADFKDQSLVTVPDGCTDFMFAFDGKKILCYVSTCVRENKKLYFGNISNYE